MPQLEINQTAVRAFDGSNIWVTNQASNTVTELQASNGVLLGTYNVGNTPKGIAFDGASIWSQTLKQWHGFGALGIAEA